MGLHDTTYPLTPLGATMKPETYYNPESELLHTKDHLGWHPGTVFYPNYRQNVILPPPPPAIEKQLQLLTPNRKKELLKEALCGYELKLQQYKLCRPQGWHNPKDVPALKRSYDKQNPIHPDEKIVSMTPNNPNKQCKCCDKPATWEVQTILPEGTLDIYEGTHIRGGKYYKYFCNNHIPNTKDYQLNPEILDTTNLPLKYENIPTRVRHTEGGYVIYQPQAILVDTSQEGVYCKIVWIDDAISYTFKKNDLTTFGDFLVKEPGVLNQQDIERISILIASTVATMNI